MERKVSAGIWRVLRVGDGGNPKPHPRSEPVAAGLPGLRLGRMTESVGHVRSAWFIYIYVTPISQPPATTHVLPCSYRYASSAHSPNGLI